MKSSRLVQATALSTILVMCLAATAVALPNHMISSITPDNGQNTGTVSVTIEGTGFEAGETVWLEYTGQSNINGTSVVIVSSEELTCNFDLTGALVAHWGVGANNGSYGTTTLSGAFEVQPHHLVAVIDSITPAPALHGASVTFTGHGVDDDPGHTIDAHQWRSNLDGAIGSTASFSTTALTRGDHTIEYRVQCSHGDWSDWTAWGSNPLVIQNNPPTVTSVAITPDPADTSDDLVAVPAGWADADGDPEGYDYQWEKDTGGGFAVIAGQTTDTLGSANFAKGDVVRVTCTPNDGFDTGTPVTDTITISNAAPTAPIVDVTPDSPVTDDDLTVAATGSTDADSDTVTYSYEWFKDGTAQAAYDDLTTVPSSATSKGETWKCVVTPNDGTDDGPTGEDQVTIANTAPTAPTVAIAPANPTTRNSFRVTASGSADANGDAVTYSYQWYKDGVLQSGVTWRTIGSSRTRPGQVWRCVVTPNDGDDDGPTGEATVTVNGRPTAPTVTITPDDPTNKEDLMAHASGSTDADGDAVTCKYEWFKDGVAQPDLTGMKKIRSWRTRPGQVWRCVVTPNDGTNNGPTGEDTVTINTRPGPPVVVINGRDGTKSPALDPDTTQNLASQIVSCVDADGDAVTYTYQWYKNGVLQPGVTWRSIGSWRTRVGQEWTLVVTPSDLHGEGKPGEATVTIQPATKTGGPVTVSALAALPTAAGAEMTFTLSANASVTCEVLNIAGRAVKTIIADRAMEAGVASLSWDGRNAAGLRAPGGMYLVRMTATGADGSRWTSMGTLSLTR